MERTKDFQAAVSAVMLGLMIDEREEYMRMLFVVSVKFGISLIEARRKLMKCFK